MFIHTFEMSGTATADAKAYLLDNHYSLPLYMDLKNRQDKNNPAALAFKINGIPNKFVIDGNGKIRFQLAGFGIGRDQAHADELSAMIEVARKLSPI